MSDKMQLSETMTATLATMMQQNREAGARAGYAVRQKMKMLQDAGHTVTIMTDVPGLLRIDNGPELTINQFLSL